MGVPLVIIHIIIGFSLTNHPAIGVPPWLWKSPNVLKRKAGETNGNSLGETDLIQKGTHRRPGSATPVGQKPVRSFRAVSRRASIMWVIKKRLGKVRYWGFPSMEDFQKWMVYGKSDENRWVLGLPLFQETTISKSWSKNVLQLITV